MFYMFNPDLILRHEFYGGLIHSRLNGNRWETSHEDATFLWALDQCGDPGSALSVVEFVYPGSFYIPDIEGMTQEQLILPYHPKVQSRALLSVKIEAVEQLAESKERNYLRAPVNLSIYPYMVCQLDCDFCFITTEKWVREVSSLNGWKNLIREAKVMGVPFLSILGGDPLLYPFVSDLVRFVDEVGIKSTITTNGLHLDSERLAALVETQMITPTVSIQSLDGFHEKITGKPNDNSLLAIQKLVSHGKECRVNAVYTEQTDEQLFALLDYCLESGVSKFTLAVFINIRGTQTRVRNFSEYRVIYDKIMDRIYKSGRKDFDFQVEGCQLFTAYPNLENPVSSHYEQLTLGCEAGNSRCEVMFDGTVLPCALLNQHTWGDSNAFESGLQTAWDNSNAMEKIRSYKNTDSSCNSCGYGSFCNGGCPAMNEKQYGSIETYGDSRCEIRDEIQGKSRRLIPVRAE